MQVKRKSFLMILLVIVLTFSVGLLAFANNYQAGAQSSVENESNVLTQGIKQTSVKYYNVEIANISHGTITADKTVVEAGDTVVLTIVADYGYMYKQGSLFVNGGTVPTGGHAFFIMPNKDVIVTAEFESNGTPLQDYAITILESENGTVTADKQTAKVGETVTLDIAPDLGYKLVENSLKVNGGAIEITDNAFVMPASDILVSAEFESRPASIALAYKLINNDTEYQVVGIGGCKDIDVVIPSIFVGKPVTSISNRAFENCTNLVSVYIPNSIMEIGSYAFSNCSNIKSMVIPDSVVTIYEFLFNNCTSLIDVTLQSNAKSIVMTMFSGCRSLTTIKIPSTVTSIGQAAFNDCVNLTSIEIPESVKTIGDGVFYNCQKLKSIEIPKSLISLPKQAFYNCKSLETVILQDNFRSIGQGTFENCISLKSIEIPEGVGIAGSAFKGCTGLVSIEIPSNVIAIFDYVFYGCTNLTNVILPNNLMGIGAYAFYGCVKLENITIPKSVTGIGDSAFRECVALSEIIIPKSVTGIGVHAFYNCNNLIIKCETESKPAKWNSGWNSIKCPVIWGYTGE